MRLQFSRWTLTLAALLFTFAPSSGARAGMLTSASWIGDPA
jgi:hypothetical protein